MTLPAMSMTIMTRHWPHEDHDEHGVSVQSIIWCPVEQTGSTTTKYGNIPFRHELSRGMIFDNFLIWLALGEGITVAGIVG